MWILYQIALALALLVAAPVLWLRRGRHYWATLGGRLARSNAAPKRHDLWLHAVSVGEVAVASTLIGRLPGSLSILVSTVTPTGQAQAAHALSRRATIAYLPFDLGFCLRRFFRSHQPAALILVESELWPLLLRHCLRRQMPVYVVNGRISDRSFRRMKALRPVLGPLLEPVGLFLVQSETDRDRYLSLGAEPHQIVVTGNLKYDSPEPESLPALEQQIDRLAGGRPVLVAGSTMEGEEGQVVEAFSSFGAGRRALLVLAPRHPERFDEVAELVVRAGLRLQRRTELEEPPALEHRIIETADTDSAEVLLLDSLGELSSIYRLAGATFIGGTLVATGGHNPLEPARFARPIAVGPSMENFRHMAAEFDRRQAWARVSSSADLADAWRQFLEEPEQAAAVGGRAQQLFEVNRGAVDRTLVHLAPILEQP